MNEERKRTIEIVNVVATLLEAGHIEEIFVQSRNDWAYIRDSHMPVESGYKYEIELSGEVWPYVHAVHVASALISLTSESHMLMVVSATMRELFSKLKESD